MVFVGDKFKITSRPKNAAGQLLDKVARWTVAAPTIAKQVDSLKAITTFKALKAGATTVKATIDAKSSSAKLVVRSVTGAKVVLTPAQVTVASGATTQFTVTGLTTTGEKPAVNVTWKVTGGTVTTAGLFKAGTVAGTYRVIATSLFGAADTSAITVTATPSPIAKVVLTPASATLASGATVQFAAYGRTQAGDSVAATVSYTATGGTIATTGIYTAGTTPGTYRVIATAATHSDTSDVVISAPPPATAGLTLMPDIAASRPGASTQFTTQVVNASGQTTTSPVQYSATCGGITTDGIYSAPSGASGSCLVIAAAGDKSDTTEVKLLSDSRNRGTPFGIFGLWSTALKVPDPGLALFNASHDNIDPGNLLNQIAAARAKGVHLLLAMTGGSHERFKTNGVFDLAKWQAAMDAFNTPAIKSAVADAVADGVIIGNSVMDEPFQADQGTTYREKSWGPVGTMTKARVDGLCAYNRRIFPTMPQGVFHDATAPSSPTARITSAISSSPSTRFGRGRSLPGGTRRSPWASEIKIAIVFSLNILDGGPAG
jgi:hypothetical protein